MKFKSAIVAVLIIVIFVIGGCERYPGDAAVNEQYRSNLIINKIDNEKIYWKIYNALINLKENILIISDSPDTALDIYQIVLAEHPEIFWSAGASITKWSYGDRVLYGKLYFQYDKTAEQCSELQSQIDNYILECLQGIDSSFGEYEKTKYVFDYLVDHTQYVVDSQDNQNICSVFVYGQSVCSGYAKALQYILNELNIDCAVVTGTVKNGESHAWNLLRLDDEYYYIDMTWGEVIYEDGSTAEDISYDYFCVTSKLMDKTHSAADGLQLPECLGEKYNYYIKEGRMFDSYNISRLADIMRGDYDDGQSSSTVRFANDTAYEAALGSLGNPDDVYQLLSQSGVVYDDNIWYTTDADVRTVKIIWTK